MPVERDETQWIIPAGMTSAARWESLLSLLGAGIIALGAVGVAVLLYVHASRSAASEVAYLLGVVGVGAGEFFLFQSIRRAHDAEWYPLPLQYALRFDLPVRWLRFPLAVALFLHVPVAILIALRLNLVLAFGLEAMTGGNQFVGHLALGATLFGMTHAALLHLMLTLRLLGLGEVGLARVWRFRLLADLLVMACGMLFFSPSLKIGADFTQWVWKQLGVSM
jgi:hypothetical protein